MLIDYNNKYVKINEVLFLALLKNINESSMCFEQVIKIFIIQFKEQMEVGQQSHQQQEGPPSVPELKLTPIFSLSLSYDIYRVCVGEASFIAKVFPPAKLAHFQREKSILTQMNHAHIIKPIDFSHALVSKLASSVINAFILFPQYPKGDLLSYVKANGTLSERVARFYTKQIIEALSYAHDSLILHPQLLAENILLDQNRNALVCGWSNSLNHQNKALKDLLFSTGQLIISLVTSRMPFISKDSKNDTFAKFLEEKYIHKLWEQIEKVVKKFNKGFQFSGHLKELLEGLLLGKIDTFKDVLECKWLKQPISPNDVYEELKNQEKNAFDLKETKKNKVINAQKQEKEMIKNNFSLHLNRKPSRSSDIFQEQYEHFSKAFINIEEKSKSDRHLYFKIFDKDVRFIVSHLRARLRQAQREQEGLIDGLLILKDFQVTIDNSILKVNFTFGWNYDEIQENNMLCGFNHSIDVVMRTEQNNLLGRLEMNENVELNTSCVHQLNQWVVEALQHYG